MGRPKEYEPLKERIPYSTKTFILGRDEHRCSKCKTPNWLEVHHIIPLYRGGSNNNDNLITLCSLCHRYAPEHPIEFFKFMAQPNRPPIDLAMDVAEQTFMSAIALGNEDLEIARSDPQKFWRSRYRTGIQRALSWLYEQE